MYAFSYSNTKHGAENKDKKDTGIGYSYVALQH